MHLHAYYSGVTELMTHMIQRDFRHLGTTLMGRLFVILDTLLVIMLLLIMFLLLAYVWQRQVHTYKKKRLGPKAWPIIGSQIEIIRNYDCLLDWIGSFFDEDHRTICIRLLGRTSFITVDPDNVHHILKSNFSNYPKGNDLHQRQFDLLGKGILNTDGALWRTHRKIASLEFSIKRLKYLGSTVYRKHALRLLSVISNSCQGVDMQELILAMTFDSICEVIMDEKLDTLLSFLSSSSNDSLANSLDIAQEMMMWRYMFPWWKIQRFLDLGSENILRRESNKVKLFVANVIDKRRLSMEVLDGSSPPDLLSHFLSTIPQKDERNSKMQLEEVNDAMVNFIFAGRDTTGCTLSWFLYCMSTHQDKQDKVFNELLKLEKSHGNQTSDSQPLSCDEYANVITYETLQNETPYLHAALTETLRLYPAVPRDGKIALEDDILPDGTIVKAGDQVAYMPYAMGRMRFLWGDDALEYKPERWLQDGVFQPVSPFKFTAFQAGPRMCLGKDASYLQMKITVALLLRFFRFELASNNLIKYKMMSVMLMKHGLKLNFSRR